MKTLIKLFLIIATFFALTFVIIKLFDLITIDDIQSWLEAAKEMSPLYIGLLVVVLLFADLFIAIPTMTVCILAGYFLGAGFGALFAIIGVTFAGVVGHLLSRSMGRTLLEKFVREDEKLKDMESTFQQHGFVMILISRALPILPETTACLSGLTRMPIYKFLLAWVISSYPYVTIAAYAGSVSTLDDPKPAIFTAIALSAFFWASWGIFYRYKVRGAKI